VLVEIYSDVICPWCYIGKRRFEQALAELGDEAADIEVRWRPFQLDPSAPAEGMPALDGYARKFGGPARAVQIVEQVSAVAATVGLEFHLDEAWRANTFDAHRLLWWAEHTAGPAAQGALKERLLRAYFVEREHVGDHEVLARLAGEAGLDPAEAAAVLASSTGSAEVRSELETAGDRDITAVPTFVIDGAWAIPGAQEPETLAIMLRRWKARQAEMQARAAAACADEACEI
jgi:predicted DsbA family dithiol-disulfide isomerase